VYVVSPDGGLPKRITNHPAQDSVATWANDSRSIYFSSTRSGRYALLKMPVEDETPTEISADGGSAAAESPDGKWRYFLRSSPAGSILVRKPLAGGSPEEQIAALINVRAYEVVQDGLYYISPPAAREPAAVRFLGNDGRRLEIARLPKPASYGLSVFPRTRARERMPARPI